MRRLSALIPVLWLAACGGGAPDASSFGGMSQPGITGASGSSESTAAGEVSTSAADGASSTSSSSGAVSSTGAAASTDETLWDMGVPDFGSLQPAGCRGKIDFLFVISSSGHMVNDQAKLLAAFPEFMKAIAAQWPDFDIHILSANTNEGGIDLGDCSICTDGCDPQGEPPYCGEKFSLCDKQIGASVTFPTGDNASNRRCELDSGLRYITSGQDNLVDAFTCIAQVGTTGGTVGGQAMVEALSPEFNDPLDEDACNRGFLREDAFLVVTIIQDGYDQDSLGTVDQWIAALRKAKHGDEDAFAVLVLTTDIDLGYGQLCFPDESSPNKNRLRALAEGVEHGFVGSICADSFVPFFTEHVGVLADLCDDFVPPG